MIEVLFNDSACANLTLAQPHEKNDIICFDLLLSIGNIVENTFIEQRNAVFNTLYHVYPFLLPFQITATLYETLHMIYQRMMHKEIIRIWYSDVPDEMCGLYWLLFKLYTLHASEHAIRIAKLPNLNLDISEVRWDSYANEEQTVSNAFMKHCHDTWLSLQKSDLTLRAIINGTLQSVPETFYDPVILQEIRQVPQLFQEAVIVGLVLDKYQLGIRDTWIAYRMNYFIAQGYLSVARNAPLDSPTYHRIIKKEQSF